MECDTPAITSKHEMNFDFVAMYLNRCKKSMYSPAQTLRFLTWRIRIKPIIEGTRKTASRFEFYLTCNGEAESFGRCNINAELTVVASQGAKNVVKETRDVLYSKKMKWTMHYFMLQCDDIKPRWAYIQNNSIILKAHVTAEYTPQGINWEQMRLTSTKSQDSDRSEATFDFAVENISKIKIGVYSSQKMIQNLPWKIFIGQTSENVSDPNSRKNLAFRVKCDGDKGNSSWSCSISAKLMVISQIAGVQNVVKSVKQVYTASSNTWGHNKYMSWNHLLNPASGFILNDKVIFRVHMVAEKPQGMDRGYVGLKNQVTKSYINSLLQTLFFTNQLQKATYEMHTKNDDIRNVTLALQRVFFDLQTESTAVDVKHFSRSLYCEALDLYAPHDLRKFIQLLFEKLKCGMKCTSVEGIISKLFSGKMKSFITLNNVKYVTEEPETFYDIQLNVNEKKNINEAFRGYVPPELNVGEPSLQNAKKAVIFESFPQVLHIHLKRFQYDPLTDCCVKFNDRFEFYEKLNLNLYLHRPEPSPANYTLHAVLAHGEDYDGDQYVVFINTKCDGKWYKFVDENVSLSSKEEAIESNYGGQVTNSTNAYMLVYIRDTELKNVLTDVTEKDIPNELKTRFKNEHHTAEPINSNYHYVTMKVFWEKSPDGKPYNVKQSPIKIFKMKASTTLEQILNMVSKFFNCPVSRVKIQPFCFTVNTYNYINFDINAEKNKQIGNITESTVWNVFFSLLP